MISIPSSLKKDVTVVNELGLHARSAAKLAKTANQAEGRVWLGKGEDFVDAKQVIDILTLAAAQGDRVCVAVELPADAGTLNAIVALFESGFGE